MSAHILAIDDSKTIRTLLTNCLEGAGFSVTTAVDGVDGVSKFQEAHADLVITDVNMPNKDGFGVIEDIRGGDVNRGVPVLVLTTESGAALKEKARKAGATGWIVKPFDDDSLVSVIRRLTGA
ncbi:response regulator [Yoonia sediminilitoris]|uniref:Two-component system chemotaxis response regulator CheY n=1 Tax=Yoonia sediminilitoris TaxID=1286148 RepID=A0A2T6KQB1_9RHOB|nr:response regulator [Yoonia sediminilitoris]PUB18738.1 two-component system chemotaxis response regulator CheY [Yoonia sediminilitoris]RCW98906.1 two-component system chemotaxis response regulator CheY [Yoonia sediminilitoris]